MKINAQLNMGDTILEQIPIRKFIQKLGEWNSLFFEIREQSLSQYRINL